MIGLTAVISVCLLSPGRSQPDILYQDEPKNYQSHQVWVRQTDQGEASGLLFQRQSRQTQVCQGPGRLRGRCVPVDTCVLQDIHQDYVKNKEYFCALRGQGGIGVCCPESITSPVTYHASIFSVSRPSRSPAEATDETQQKPGGTSNVDDRIATTSDENLLHTAYPSGDWRVCGRNGKQMSKVTSGVPITVKDWPWMAALVNRQTGKHFCGGTLITKRHVLTAAHCFPRPVPGDVLLLLGDYNLKLKDDSKARVFTPSKIIKHEDYDTNTFENDIAIVVLNKPAIYNSFIQPCCLPAPGPMYPNLTAIVTGWGRLDDGGLPPDVLMEVPVPVWDQQRCVPNFAQTIFNTNLCAGAYEGGKDACQGDSGGPMVTQRNDGRWTIVGLVSWGVGCGMKNKPGVYIRVNQYLDWISDTISS